MKNIQVDVGQHIMPLHKLLPSYSTAQFQNLLASDFVTFMTILGKKRIFTVSTFLYAMAIIMLYVYHSI